MKCWEDGIQTWSVEPEMAYDPSKLNKIKFEGNIINSKVTDRLTQALNVHPSFSKPETPNLELTLLENMPRQSTVVVPKSLV